MELDRVTNRIKVFASCTGVDSWRGGIETFFREFFDGVYGSEGLDLTLLTGPGVAKPGEHPLWCLRRTGRLAPLIGKIVRRSPYTVEQMSSMPGIIKLIRREKPQIIFSSEGNLLNYLLKFRKRIGVPFHVIYSNGAPLQPPFAPGAYVHQVTPLYYQQALEAGHAESMQYLVPYGLTVPDGEPVNDSETRRVLRAQLGLPADRKIVISVGWISATHKRMDHLVREIAQLPEPRPFVVMLGRMDESSDEIIGMSEQLLGANNYLIKSVPYEQVWDFYTASDVFALCSLREGFGRVYLEALMQGLPCVVHDHPVTRFVLGGHGRYVRMDVGGELSAALKSALGEEAQVSGRNARRNWVREQFSWESLRPRYVDMFRHCIENDHGADGDVSRGRSGSC